MGNNQGRSCDAVPAGRQQNPRSSLSRVRRALARGLRSLGACLSPPEVLDDLASCDTRSSPAPGQHLLGCLHQRHHPDLRTPQAPRHHPEDLNNVMAYHWATLANQRMTRTIWMQSNVVATIAVGPAVLDLAPKGQAHGFKLATSRQMVELTKAIDNVIVRHLPASRHPLYLPTDHTAQVVDILVPTPKPLQSAARVPFLDEFLVRSSRAPAAAAAAVVSTKQVIFPAGDGCRQDCLALQFIRLAQGVFASVDLPLFVYPYPLAMPNRTRATRALGGVIECVRRSASRDDLSKSNGLSPRGYFLSKFGRAEGAAVKQEAQRHFVLSMAGAHAFCSYLLQVKDQHSGHILLDDDGHVVHIDFGFIFDISPAKDMKVEPGGSKLTLDMVEVMDKYDSVRWKWFVELRTSGNLVVRAHRDDFLSIADLMSTHALGCFKADTVANLR
ncbi:unnamed protein product (mitochondrion) [Plasmodiophora brassicae]|uniref:PI3K/PI4K catalytic domain-containing protein n=2 Tax=Plasmodiophora brassicae TaxID=37360 RepID=A0A3P3Y5M5_PLABS|nr:unnamed protein product [Plasmodiophora brassicae]